MVGKETAGENASLQLARSFPILLVKFRINRSYDEKPIPIYRLIDCAWPSRRVRSACICPAYAIPNSYECANHSTQKPKECETRTATDAN